MIDVYKQDNTTYSFHREEQLLVMLALGMQREKRQSILARLLNKL